MSRADYRQVLTIAARLRSKGFLKRFKTDLVKHDKKTLLTSEGPYLWSIREDGTHLLTQDLACHGINHGKAWRTLPKIFDGQKVKMYYSRGNGAPPKAINSAVAGKIAQKWEDTCRREGRRKGLWDK